MMASFKQKLSYYCRNYFWPVITLFLLLFIIYLLVDLFGNQKHRADNALNSAQRLSVTLKGEPQWDGILIRTPAIPPEELPEDAGEKTLKQILAPDESAQDNAESLDETAIAVLDQTTQEAEIEVVASDDLKKALQEPNINDTNIETNEPTKDLALLPSEQVAKAKAELAKNPVNTANNAPLRKAPVPELIESKGSYMLPKISPQGVAPWQYYRKQVVVDDNKPVIALIIKGLGLGRLTTEQALNLDPRITLSFSPYAKNAQMWGSHARNIGHEIMVDLPQQTSDYPASDPGPYGLLNSNDAATNTDRLHWVLSRVSGFVGMLQPTNAAPAGLVIYKAFQELANRGIFLVESTQQSSDAEIKNKKEMGLISIDSTVEIDEILSDEMILNRLDQLIVNAKDKGYAIGTARPYPLTISVLTKWLEKLEEENIALLVPVSTIAEKVSQ